MSQEKIILKLIGSKNYKKKQGITLIALIITVIALLILARCYNFDGSR